MLSKQNIVSRALHILKNNNLRKEVVYQGRTTAAFVLQILLSIAFQAWLNTSNDNFYELIKLKQFWWTWGRKLISLFTFQLTYGSSMQNSYLRTLMHYSANQAPYILNNSIIVILVEFYYREFCRGSSGIKVLVRAHANQSQVTWWDLFTVCYHFQTIHRPCFGLLPRFFWLPGGWGIQS